MSKKTSLRNQSAIFLIILAAILIFVNILSVRFFTRIDLTRDKIFTLSKASINMMKKLDDKLVVKVYFTKNLPGHFASLERQLGDLLNEYQQHSNGKMSIEFIDPEGNEKEEEIAKKMGIKKMPCPIIEKDKKTIIDGYRAISFSYGQHQESIPSVDTAVGMEYEITTSIKKILGLKDNIGFVIGHGEPMVDPPNNLDRPLLPAEKANRGAYRNIRTHLEIYNYKDIDFKEGKSGVPPDVDALILVGSSKPLTEKELYRIDQFLLSGKSVAVFYSNVGIKLIPPEFPVLPPTFVMTQFDAGINDFLKHHGAIVGDHMVFDMQSSKFMAQCPPLPMSMPKLYPAWPLVTSFDEDHSVTYRLSSLTFPFSTYVALTVAAKNDPEKDASELAFSSGNSWRMAFSEDAVVDPCSIVIPKEELESNIPMAVAMSGIFTSYFAEKENPFDPNGDLAKRFIKKSKKPGRLIVVGTPDIPLDQSIVYLSQINNRQAHSNFAFVENTLDWMTNSDELISVRMKTVDDPPIKPGRDDDKIIAKWANIIFIPFFFALFGLVRWIIRTKKSSKRS